MFDTEKITMTVKVEKPPIWDEAHKHFKIVDEQTVYAYENILYNPSDISIDIFLMEHEKVAGLQQLTYEGGAKAWWQRYFTDAEFRKEQDFEQYWHQYRLFCQHFKSIDKRFKYRWQLAGTFAGTLQDKSVSRMEACNLLKTEIHK